MVVLQQNWRKILQRPIVFSRFRFGLAAIFLTVVLVVPAMEHAHGDSIFLNNGGGMAQLRAALSDPLQYFARRSPGARGPGALLQTKNGVARPSTKAIKPFEKVLANVRYGPPALNSVNDLVPNDVLPNAGPFPESAPLAPFVNDSSRQISPSFPVSFPVLASGVPGGGVAGPTGGGTTPSTVPEPSTWAMLILGVFLMGPGLRSSKRRIAQCENAASV